MDEDVSAVVPSFAASIVFHEIYLLSGAGAGMQTLNATVQVSSFHVLLDWMNMA